MSVATRSVLVDGRSVFGCSLEAWPDHPLNADGLTSRRFYGRRELDILPLDAIADVEAVPVFVQMGMLVVRCPDCAEKPESELSMVWREGPHLFVCGVCGNAGVDGRWRPCSLPDELDAIETVLSHRPLGTRSMAVGQTPDELRAENRRFGWVVSGEG